MLLGESIDRFARDSVALIGAFLGESYAFDCALAWRFLNRSIINKHLKNRALLCLEYRCDSVSRSLARLYRLSVHGNFRSESVAGAARPMQVSHSSSVFQDAG
jgi:hypothetical protein